MTQLQTLYYGRTSMKTSPAVTTGGFMTTPSRRRLTQSAARRVDSSVPAWSSQTVMVVMTSPERSAYQPTKPGTLLQNLGDLVAVLLQGVIERSGIWVVTNDRVHGGPPTKSGVGCRVSGVGRGS